MDSIPQLDIDVEAYRQAAGISVNELAARTHIPRTTLIRCIADPDQFRVGQWVAIARELNIPTTAVA